MSVLELWKALMLVSFYNRWRRSLHLPRDSLQVLEILQLSTHIVTRWILVDLILRAIILDISPLQLLHSPPESAESTAWGNGGAWYCTLEINPNVMTLRRQCEPDCIIPLLAEGNHSPMHCTRRLAHCPMSFIEGSRQEFKRERFRLSSHWILWKLYQPDRAV